MNVPFRISLVVLAAASVSFGITVRVAEAVDGVKLINQSRALAGGVTPGDAPGFPVTISTRGSYRLSGNLTVPDINKTAIEMTVDNITLDLNGFGIFGVWTSGPAGAGIGIYAHQANITVINGNVRGMGLHGIFLGGFAHRVEGVHATTNGGRGIVVSRSSLVKNSTGNANNDAGIEANSGSTVTGNTANDNQVYGMVVGCPSTVIGNTAIDNVGGNLFFTDADCTSADNTAP